MANNEMVRLVRLTAIVAQLQSRRIVTAAQIAAKFSISIRTVYRDIKALEQAGIPICTEEGKGYSVMEGFRLPPVMFTESEANALITAEQLVAKNKDASFVKDYTEAITKIKAVLQYNTKDKADLLSKRVVFRQNVHNDITSNYLSSLQLALTNLNCTVLTYNAAEKKETTVRTVEPFAVYSTQENWLLIAWCRLRKGYRAFRLDRIKKMEVLNEKFTPHKITLQQYFEICREKYFSSP
jgi:predicted DNA-binding transcriptional regulator YafY